MKRVTFDLNDIIYTFDDTEPIVKKKSLFENFKSLIKKHFFL